MSVEMKKIILPDANGNEIEFEVVDEAARGRLDGHDSAIQLEHNRITEIASIGEGSTTGDAELMDIRVGADGTTYASAGDAVRVQVDDIKSGLQEAGFVEVKSANVLNPSDVLLNTAMGDNGSTWSDSNSAASGYIEIKPNTKYSCFAKTGSTIVCLAAPRVCAFDANKNFIEKIGAISYSAGSVSYVTTPATAKYIRMYWTKANYQGFGTVMVAETDGTTMPTKIVDYSVSHEFTNVKKWLNKKWTAFGDSLTEENSRTTMHYHDYIANETGITVVNMGDSGSGYAKEKEYGSAFYQRIADVPTDSDVVTIFGSFNDLSSGISLGTASDSGTDTIGGCVNTCLDNLFNVFPLANVGIVAPTPWNGDTANPTTEPNAGSNYVQLLHDICQKRGIPFLDLFHCSGLRSWDEDFRALAYSKDDGNGVHPDETGHMIIAPKFKAFLESLII